MDPVDRLLDNVDSGKSLIKNRDVLHFTYIPERILHRDKQQEMVTQSLIPLYQKSIPSNLLVYGKPGTGKTLVVKKVLKQIQEREIKRTGIPSLKISFNNVFGYYLEVRNTHKDKVPEESSPIPPRNLLHRTRGLPKK